MHLLHTRSDELQLEEHDRIDGGKPSTCTGLVHQLTHKGPIKGSFRHHTEFCVTLNDRKCIEARIGGILTHSRFTPLHKNWYGIIKGITDNYLAQFSSSKDMTIHAVEQVEKLLLEVN